MLSNQQKIIIKKLIYLGGKYYCPVCKSSLRVLKPAGVKFRTNAVCPVCGSLERHRLLWLYFTQRTDLFNFSPKKMLHIAPESCFVHNLEKLHYIDYLTADLYENAMVKLDITNIQYPDNFFDVIYCSHVLEHVVDDRKAMSELSRVLKPSGWSILQVPIKTDQTFEDWTITDPINRARFFGQSDHVRVYGLDYKNRLEESGFKVNIVPFLEQIENKLLKKYALSLDKDDIYVCTKFNNKLN